MAQPEGREEQKWSRAGAGLAPWAQSWGHGRLGVLLLKKGFAVALLWTAGASINGSSHLIPTALGLVAQQAPQALKMQLFCYGLLHLRASSTGLGTAGWGVLCPMAGEGRGL